MWRCLVISTHLRSLDARCCRSLASDCPGFRICSCGCLTAPSPCFQICKQTKECSPLVRLWIQPVLVGACAHVVESTWNVMAHGDAREEKWRGNKRMEWVTSKRHMTAEHRLAQAVQTLQADVHSSTASSRLNWRPRRFKWTRSFRRKTKSGFCACAITFQTHSTLKPVLVHCWCFVLQFFCKGIYSYWKAYSSFQTD